MYYDKDGNKLTLLQFAELLDDARYRRVAETKVGHGPNKKIVSTVWRGIDHGLGILGIPGAPRLTFESMVFCNGSMRGDIKQLQHTTEAQARLWHGALVTMYHLNHRQRRQAIAELHRTGRLDWDRLLKHNGHRLRRVQVPVEPNTEDRACIIAHLAEGVKTDD